MRSWLAAIGVLVLALGLEPSLTMARVDPPQSLSSLVFQYLDSADSEEAERFLELLLNHPDTSVERVTRIIETERTYDAQPIGTIANEEVRVEGQIYSVALSIPLTYRSANGYALVVCLHGAGFTGDVYLERWQARLGEEYLLACPTYPSGAWFTRREEVVLATIEHVRRRYHVDPDRIFLQACRMRDRGLLIGMHHAPLFAGVAPMAGRLDDVLMPFLANSQYSPIYMIHGEKDQVMPVALSRSISRELTALGYSHVYREHQGEHPVAGGHYFPREELPALRTWLDRQRRDPAPPKLSLVREASRFHPSQLGARRRHGRDRGVFG